MKFLFVAKGKDNPTTRYRVLPLVSRLHQRDIKTSLFDGADGLIGKLKLLSLARQVDCVFVQRKLFAPWFTRLLKRCCDQIIFDFDDAIFCKSNGQASASRMRKFRGMLASSTLVFPGNHYLAEECEKQRKGLDKMVVPTAVDDAPYQRGAVKEQGCMLVWLGSRSTGKYLEQVRPILEEIGQRIPDITLKVIADFKFTLVHMKVINIAWSKEAELIHLANSHIGLAPMSDDPWTKGKCALKVIQYMAAGLPVISSKVGANAEVVVSGETGLLLDSADDWLQAIDLLYHQPDERARMGEAGYQRMLAHYSQDFVFDAVMEKLDTAVLMAN